MSGKRPIDVTRGNSRHASVLVCVLVCLAVATSLVTSTVRSALHERRAMRTQHQLRQTEMLLAAGVQRAVAQLREAPDYSGETWGLPPEVIASVESAQAIVTVTPGNQRLERTVHVTARVSTGPHTDIQRSHSFTVVIE